MYICIYVYMYICICVCVCVSAITISYSINTNSSDSIHGNRRFYSNASAIISAVLATDVLITSPTPTPEI